MTGMHIACKTTLTQYLLLTLHTLVLRFIHHLTLTLKTLETLLRPRIFYFHRFILSLTEPLLFFSIETVCFV